MKYAPCNEKRFLVDAVMQWLWLAPGSCLFRGYIVGQTWKRLIRKVGCKTSTVFSSGQVTGLQFSVHGRIKTGGPWSHSHVGGLWLILVK